jgi:hypothetical protein
MKLWISISFWFNKLIVGFGVSKIIVEEATSPIRLMKLLICAKCATNGNSTTLTLVPRTQYSLK